MVPSSEKEKQFVKFTDRENIHHALLVHPSREGGGGARMPRFPSVSSSRAWPGGAALDTRKE